MGFLKDLGSFVGEVAGTVIGGSVKVVGEITGVQLLEEIGDGVKKASSLAGETMGKAASGIWDVGAGIITQNEQRLDEGFNDVGGAIGTTVKGIGGTIINIAENSGKVIEGAISGDSEGFSAGAKGLIKTAAVGALAIGVLDMAVDLDGSDSDVAIVSDTDSSVEIIAPQDAVINSEHSIAASNSDILIENSNTHHVEPHFRELSNGTTIWVDGDGDSTVDTYDGWTQHNPDYREKA